MKLNQVTLTVKDISLATDFYLRLGLIQIVASEYYARFLVPENQATLSISEDHNISPENVSSSTKIYFEFDRLAQLNHKISQLNKRNIPILQPISIQPYLWHEAIIQDPSGNIIILFYAGDNRINPPWRITKTFNLAH